MRNIFIHIGLALTALQSGIGPAWPRIVPISVSVPIRLGADRIDVDIPLRDPTGREQYHFACRGGGEPYLDSLDGNWVGPLMCTLAVGTKAREESLLSEDEAAAWHSRGQFFASDLVGNCAKYPEFGVRRTFRLRGIRLELEARNVQTDATVTARSFVLAVSVTSDPAAMSAQAERPGFLDPHHLATGCEVVRKGVEPRMCRDWANGGSWVPCKN